MSGSRGALVAGLGLHLGLLLLPFLFLGPRVDGALAAFWAFVLALHLAEAGAVRGPRWDSEALGPATRAALPQLAVFWTATVDHVLGARPGGPVPAAAGALLFALGIALRWSAMRRLGDRFLDGPSLLPAHRLETSGLYGLLRHPSEAGLLCVGAGTAVLLGSPAAALVLLAAVAPGVALRLRDEDRALAGRFGREFRAYRGSVGALVPRFLPRAPRRGGLSAARPATPRPRSPG